MNKRFTTKKAMAVWGSVAALAAIVTTAAFTDAAYLNLGGSTPLGGGTGSNVFNFQVVKTDPTTGAQVPGDWQEADATTGVPIAIAGADTIYPGSADISVDIPVKNASTNIKSALAISLAQLPDVPGTSVTDPNYLNSLRFDVDQPATAGSAAKSYKDQTFAQVKSLALATMNPGETSTVRLTIRLLSQATSGAPYDDNSLQGKAAYLQAVFNATSTN
ncbi:MAG: hypothetical protein LBR32_09885 [Propionibacteriaceae bacterium]|jgi:hypothetical protein|nr:hypothetical protein [Propionibacteriaceae bacterium]